MGRLISRKVIMRKCYVLWALVLSAVTAAKVPSPEKLKSDVLQRFKRQEADEDELERQLCQDKGAGEWFRLETGEDKCRDVIQCTASGLQAIRCPAGLAFDIEKQTCDWKASVKNCDSKTKEKKVKPLLFTDEPLCQENFLACGDGNCIERGLFCNGEKDCNDGSDENACDIDSDPNRAPPCDTTICKLPDCFCSEDGTQVPGKLCPVGPAGSDCNNVPQMITVTFTVKSSTSKGKIPMAVTSKPVSLSLTSTPTTHRCRRCTIWVMRLLHIPLLTMMTSYSGLLHLLMTGPKKWLDLVSLSTSLLTLLTTLLSV